MHEWAQKGYWSKDILSSSQDDKDNFYNGLSASYISHQPDWTGNYGNQLTKLPGVETEFYPFAEANVKITKSVGVGAATGISKNSKYPERCLMLIEKLMTDKECYDLFQYGIEGKQYVLKDGKITQPENFDAAKDGGGFAGWAFRTDNLNIPQASEDPRRYTLNDEWSKVAIDRAYVGFSFDNTNVNSELSAITNVDAQLGTQILLGKTTQDPKEAVAEYRNQLKAAGIDKLLEEVNTQVAAFNSNK
jgi:putative aldouronate transport system substrate-binding protein